MATTRTIDIESITSSSQVFAEHSVQELLQLNQRINNDIKNKRQELRNLVGSKYRDLLNVADDIISMNTLVQQQDDELTHLIFDNSSYQDKTLSNLNLFHNSITKFKKQDLTDKNLEKLVKILLDDLDDLYIQLLKTVAKFDLWNIELNIDDNEDNGNELELEQEQFESSKSEKLIEISIFAYMIEFLFKKTLNSNTLLFEKFESLKSNIIGQIKYILTELVVDSENELVLNLLTSYMILTLESPRQVFQFFLKLRFDNFILFQLPNNFQNSLKYLFNTISYINLFKTKLITMMIRTIHLNNSSIQNNKSWFKSRYIVKWKNWIMDYGSSNDIKFPHSVSDLKTSLTDSQIDLLVEDWKVQISKHYLNNVSFKDTNLANQVEIVSNILIAFKHYTSLVGLQLANDENLIDQLLANWELSFNETIVSQISEYQQITSKIIKIEPGTTSQIDDSKLFAVVDFKNDLTNIESYLQKISETSSNLIGQQKDLLIEINLFYDRTKKLSMTLKQLLFLKENLVKPVLSIDDTSNDEFWDKIALNIQDIFQNSIDKISKDITRIEKEFSNNLDKLSEKDLEVSQSSNLLRCLISLNNRSNLVDLFQEIANVEKVNQSPSDLKNSSKYTTILMKFLEPLLNKLSLESIRQLQNDIYQRIEGSQQIDEVMIWDKNVKDRLIPVQPSYKFCTKLYELSNSILQNGENKDILEIDEFVDLKNELLQKLVETVIDELDDKLNKEKPVVENGQVSQNGKKKKNKKKKNGVTPHDEQETEEEKNETIENEEDNEAEKSETIEKGEEKIKTIAQEEDQSLIQNLLLTYSDLIYLIFFLQKKEASIEEELSNNKNVLKLQKILKLHENYDASDIIKIHKNIFEFFKNNKSLYIF